MVQDPLNLTKLYVYGPGVSFENIFVDQRTSFIVDSQNVGSNNVSVKINDPNNKLLDTIEINDANLSIQTISYVPEKPGLHQVLFFKQFMLEKILD